MIKQPYEKGYRRAESPRAWSDGKLTLVPPEVWKLRRVDRRTVRDMLRRAPDPEAAGMVINLVAAVSQKLDQQLPLNAAPKGRLTREQVKEWYTRMAERKAASAPSGSGSEIHPQPFEVGGYVSSIHSTSAAAPKLLSDDELLSTGASGDPAWMERERALARQRGQREAAKAARNQTWIEQWAERMRNLVKSPKNE